MRSPWAFRAIVICFVAVFFLQGSVPAREETVFLFGLWAVLILIWGWSSKKFDQWNQHELWLVGIGMLSTLFFQPNLSDDFYRFFWDGQLLLSGENPYVQLPCFYEVNDQWPGRLGPEVYESLNSPKYYTVYPPLNQVIFALSTGLSFGSITGTVAVMKLIMVLSFLGVILVSFKLLRELNLPEKRIYLLLFMPLLWIEWLGNLHFEGLMVFFLLLAILNLHREKWLRSAVFFGIAVSVKLIPLMFLPFLLRRLGWRRAMAYAGIVVAILVLPFLLFYHEHLWANYSDSLDLYFRRFEFNASIYYLLRYLGTLWFGYNPIHILGPFSAIVVIGVVIFLSWRERELSTPSLLRLMLLTHATYLFLSTTVHPWYLSVALVLAVFTELRFIFLWGAIVLLSYSAYTIDGVEESYGILLLEYIPVIGLFVYELYSGNSISREKVSAVLDAE
jgi:hypothetical protein